MDLNIILWIGGMLFSLGIFALKVGLGLGYGKVGAKGVSFTLAGYLALFIAIALLSERLMGILEPLLRKGPYLHTLTGAGLIAWGLFAIRGSHHPRRSTSEPGAIPRGSSLLLLIPCPVCITAMTFSTWAALTVAKLPALLVGLGMGFAFGAMSLLVMAVTRLRTSEHPETALGLAMIVIGLYFVASLFLPAKIEEAKGMYASFLTENNGIGIHDGMGVLATLVAAMLIGFFAGKAREVKE